MLHAGRRGGLMVSARDSGASGPGSSPDRGHCVVFLGKTLYSHSASLHPGVEMVPAMTVTMTMTIITKTKYLSAHLKLLMRLQREVTTQFDIQGN